MTLAASNVDQVIQAVRAIQDPNTSQADRNKFTQAIEALKDGPPSNSISTSFGLVMQPDRYVAHVGFNIVDDVIKFKWHEMSFDEKVSVRNGMLEWISNGDYTVSPDDTHFKTAASRVFVSMMEHEWPEHWPELIDQFGAIIQDSKLVKQSHMVFLIIRRLIEDVLTLITVQNVIRRKALQNGINSNIGKIMSLVINRLMVCVNAGNNNEEVLLAKSAIELLSEVFDWVSGKDLEPYVDSAVDVLCMYLQQDLYGIYEIAASALFKLASRRRQKFDELPIVISMFRDQPMKTILAACSFAARSSSNSQVHYKYLKALCDLMVSLGVHLSEIWLHIGSPPGNFAMYLDALTEFFRHPSLYIRSETSQVLVAFSVNESIRRTAVVLERMPVILSLIPKNLEKVGTLTDYGSPTNLFSRMDYELEQDFLQDHTRLRDRCFRMIRENIEEHFTVLSSLVTNWVNGRCIQETESITMTEWDSMKRYITTYLQVIYQGEIKPEVDEWLVVLLNNIYNRLLTLSNPSVSSELLSILSAFFIVLEHHPERISGVISLLQQCLKVVDPNPIGVRNTPDSLHVVNLKRHCINLLLKLANAPANVITPFARQILDAVIDVVPFVTTLQKANLVQVLAALSNLASTPDEQQLFLENAIRDNISFLQSQEFLTCCKSVRDFFSFVGVLSPPAVENTVFMENRLKFKANLLAIEGALSQVTVKENGVNPLFGLLLPVIKNLVAFVGTLNAIFSPEGVALVQSTYSQQILSLSVVEKQSIIYMHSSSDGIDELTPSVETDAINSMRRFLVDIGDTVQTIIGHVGAKMSASFYSLPDAAELVQGTFLNANYVPDYRLRFWIKRAWTKVICNCPADKVNVVAPVIAALTQHMKGLLEQRWDVVNELDQDGEVTEEELLSQQMVTVLSRDYSDLLRQFIFGTGLMIKEDSKKHPSELLTPLSLVALKNPVVLAPFIDSLCSLLKCPDSKTVARLLPVARCVFGTFHQLFDAQTAKRVLVQIIQSLQVNGSDDEVCGPLLGLSFSVYAWLRPSHPFLVEILSEVPESSAEKIQEFDSKVLAYIQSTENIMEKNKRELMRKILKPVIAQKLAEQYRRPVPMKPIRRPNMDQAVV